MKRLTLLITSAGRRVALSECFRDAAAGIGIELRLLACDLQPERSAACSRADAAFRVPRCDDPGYGEAILDLCRAQDVDLVVPTIDTELLPLAAIVPEAALAGVSVNVSAPDVIAVVRDKRRTAERLGAAGLAVPRTLPLEAVAAGEASIDFPVFVKPVAGSASRGLGVAASLAELPRPVEPMVVQHLLSGPEYTVNMFVDRGGVVRSAVPHRRLAVRAGEVEKAVTVRVPAFADFAERVAAALPGARGVLCFQIIDDVDAGPHVIEVNARFGGGYPLADAAGAPFARWLLEEAAGMEPAFHDAWEAGVTMLRYDAAVFRSAR